MIAQLLRFALRQRFIAIAVGIVLIGLGVYAFRQLKLEAYPDISDTQVVVITTLPGNAAEEMEQQVTVPIERAEGCGTSIGRGTDASSSLNSNR